MEDGMDMNMDGAMPLASGHGMLNYFHVISGDTLWFQGWVPQSAGATVGAFIGLFLLAIGERWVGSVRSMSEKAWAGRIQRIMTNRLNASADGKDQVPPQATGLRSLFSTQNTPPFILAHDGPRAFLHLVQTTLGYLCMLAIMTFNVWFLLAVVLGSAVGELLFGRFMSGNHVH
ncbi:hypothetical protein BDN72DRAFT_33124 [Pluteus cervinus]|uniref:Uncharacterized protein n=1 Tax=Pluteus cervinus TaxID=181527 RepID=A0ACD3BI04_9AGAR|nr:hypothetical protein BDN72DRAFT_33124 [Pluteus cervinus]